jgi:XisH protein
MPAKNLYHDVVVSALIDEGWTITHDPLTISYGGRDLFVDLGAEQSTIAAEKAGLRIAVEIQSFLNPSPVRDLEEAVGQYEIYRAVLAETEPERTLWLAVPFRIHESLLSERFGQLITARLNLQFFVFDERQERAIRWIRSTATE